MKSQLIWQPALWRMLRGVLKTTDKLKQKIKVPTGLDTTGLFYSSGFHQRGTAWNYLSEQNKNAKRLCQGKVTIGECGKHGTALVLFTTAYTVQLKDRRVYMTAARGEEVRWLLREQLQSLSVKPVFQERADSIVVSLKSVTLVRSPKPLHSVI